VENALQDLPGVTAATAAVRKSEAGVPLLVGYLVVEGDRDLDRAAAREHLASRLAAGVMPLLAVVEELPTRTSGKVDRAALPWPLPPSATGGAGHDSTGEGDAPRTEAEQWLVEQWEAVLGMPVPGTDANFFDLGGGSLAAAQLVSRIRTRVPEFAVADVYDVPRLAAMAAAVAATDAQTTSDTYHRPVPTPRRTQWLQTLAGVPLFIVGGVRWLVYLLTAGTILTSVDGDAFSVLPSVPWWLLIVMIVVVATPFGRMGIAAAAARLLLGGLVPGDYPRGGVTHMRLWLAEQFAAQIDAVGLAGAPWITVYARMLGAKVERDVSLHTLPPITGMLEIGRNSAIEPETDLSGYWIDGDLLRVGPVRIGRNVTVGARSTLAPGTRIDDGAEISPGSAVFGRVKSGQRWSGSPAVRTGGAKRIAGRWPEKKAMQSSAWKIAYGVSSVGLALQPFVAFTAGAAVLSIGIAGADTPWQALLG